MNQAIANIIKNQLTFDWVDKIAGLVTPVTIEVRDKDNTTILKTFPIACCVSADDCKEGAYNDLMPDSNYKTVVYFEDKGVTFQRVAGNFKYYQSFLRLVCWININKVTESPECNQENPCTYAAHLITDIIRSLPVNPTHISPFSYVYSEVVGQEIRSNSIFSAYSYDELHSQYLMSPYDYFALDIKTDFAICLKGTTVYDSTCS